MVNRIQLSQLVRKSLARMKVRPRHSTWVIFLILITFFACLLISQAEAPRPRWENADVYLRFVGLEDGIVFIFGMVLLLIRHFQPDSKSLAVVASSLIAFGVTGLFGVASSNAHLSMWLRSE